MIHQYQKHYGITTSLNTNVWAQPVLSQCNDTSVPKKHDDITTSLNTNVWAQPVLSQCNDTSVPKTLWHYNKSEYKRMSTTSVKSM
jgi:hypothetical protein